MYISIERRKRVTMKTINEKNYVSMAEKAIKNLRNKKDRRNRTISMVSTSKIRNLLAMTADIYNNVIILQDDKLSDELIGRIEYLRTRFVYECGREPKVKDFVEEANLLEVLVEIGDSRDNYILFNRYMESLIAYHRYYGGKEQ